MNRERFISTLEENERADREHAKKPEVSVKKEAETVDFSAFKTWRELFVKLQELNAPTRLTDAIGSVRVEARKLPRFDRNALTILAFGIPETGNLRATVIDLIELEETRRRFEQQTERASAETTKPSVSKATEQKPINKNAAPSKNVWRRMRDIFR